MLTDKINVAIVLQQFQFSLASINPESSVIRPDGPEISEGVLQGYPVPDHLFTLF